MDTQDSVVLGAPQCSGAPSGEWCSAPIGSTTNTTAESLRQELDQRFAETMPRHQISRSTAGFDRAQKARARKHGLQRRHAQKLARTQESS